MTQKTRLTYCKTGLFIKSYSYYDRINDGDDDDGDGDDGRQPKISGSQK
jgi:hypothetical protein